MIETLVLSGHLLVAALIITLVLLQRGKGAEAGTGFGAGASGTVFGSRGSASFFTRATAVLATLFFATSLALAYFSAQTTGPESLIDASALQDNSQGLQGLGGESEALPSVIDADSSVPVPQPIEPETVPDANSETGDGSQ